MSLTRYTIRGVRCPSLSFGGVTNPANLIVFFYLRCAEVYRALNDRHEGG
jgi:hypothetical protein